MQGAGFDQNIYSGIHVCGLGGNGFERFIERACAGLACGGRGVLGDGE
jgi:hypothetical protein